MHNMRINCMLLYQPDACVSLNEQMIKAKVRFAFKYVNVVSTLIIKIDKYIIGVTLYVENVHMLAIHQSKACPVGSKILLYML